MIDVFDLVSMIETRVCLFACLCVCVSWSVCWFVCWLVCWIVCFCLFVCRWVGLFVLFVCFPACLPACLLAFSCVRLRVCEALCCPATCLRPLSQRPAATPCSSLCLAKMPHEHVELWQIGFGTSCCACIWTNPLPKQGSLKDTFCLFETWLFPPTERDTTICKAMFRCIM